jgi:HEAT repeat protein/DNA replication protein DnaC
MPRNIRWDESVKENVLNLAEALLYQAEEELDDLALKEAVQVEWVTANKLRVTGKEKQQRGKREQIVEVGTRKEHLIRLVRKAGKSLKLPQRKKESSSSLQERELAEVQIALDCLRKLGVFEEEKNTRKNQGYWKFTLTLKHQTATREENLQVVRQKWKEHPKTNSRVTSSTTPILATEKSIDWREVCRTMLERHKRLTTNQLMFADEDMKFELDDIHVPLALVQRTKPDKRSGDISPEQGSRLYEPMYEEKQRFKHEEFLTQVLQQGKGQTQGRRIALIGEPGAGKTTLLQSLAFWILDQNLGLPIWISLADLQGKTLEEYFLQQWLKNALEVVRVTLEQENALLELCKSSRVWLLLDGVDEMVVGSVGVRAHVGAPLQMISSQLEGWIAKARVVLSCRLNVWEANLNALGDDFETYRLLDFDYPLQVKEFICRWFRKNDADKGERLWAELDKSERQRIQDLVKNPLRLALLCSTYNPPSPPYQGGSKDSFSSSYQGGSKDSLSSPPYQGGARGGSSGLPSTKAGLYQRFVEAFYTWKDNRFPTTEDQQEELNAALGRLAKRAIDQEVSRFRLQHRLVREELGDPKQQGSLFWLALQLGWLNQVGWAAESETQEKVYAFFHPTFQEYFAALAVDDWDFFLPRAHDNQNPKPVSERYRIFEPQWKEVILLWLGRPNEEVAKEEKEAFIKKLVEFEDRCGRFYWYRAYFLAASGITEFEDFTGSDAIVARIIRYAFGYFNIKKKYWISFFTPISKAANAVLKETIRTQAIASLVEFIENYQSEKILVEATVILAEIRNGNSTAIERIFKDNSMSVEALVELIGSFHDEDTCRQAATRLGEIGKGDSTAVNALIQLIQNSQDEYTRLVALESLGKIAQDPPIAVSILVESTQNLELDEEDTVPNLESLWEIYKGNPIAVAALVELIEDSHDENTLQYAAYSLGIIGEGNSKAISTLVELIRNSHDENTLQQAAKSLGKIDRGNSSAIATLTELIENSQDDSTRLQAISSLARIDESNSIAISAVVQLLENSQDNDTVRQAIWILGKIGKGNPTAIAALVELTQNSQNLSTIWHAVATLGEIAQGNPTAITALVKLLTQNSQDEVFTEYILEEVIRSLAKVGKNNPIAITTLMELIGNLENKSDCGRALCWTAADYLKEILAESQMAEVVTILKDYLDKNESWRFQNYYNVLWHCAQSMTYRDFYQAWHQQEELDNTTTPNPPF